MATRTQVYSITSAQTALSVDQASRTRRYLLSMAVRTLCFLGAVFTDSWVRWALVAGAVVLPYLAVVVANGGRERTKDAPPVVFVRRQQVALPSQAVDRTGDGAEGPRGDRADNPPGPTTQAGPGAN